MLYFNQRPQDVASERRQALRRGARRAEPSDPMFLTIAITGEIKWAVDRHGILWICSKWIGLFEVSHTFLIDGDPVRGIGEAYTIVGSTNTSLYRIDHWSGHYQPDSACLPFGITAFAAAGFHLPPQAQQRMNARGIVEIGL